MSFKVRDIFPRPVRPSSSHITSPLLTSVCTTVLTVLVPATLPSLGLEPSWACGHHRAFALAGPPQISFPLFLQFFPQMAPSQHRPLYVPCMKWWTLPVLLSLILWFICFWEHLSLSKLLCNLLVDCICCLSPQGEIQFWELRDLFPPIYCCIPRV